MSSEDNVKKISWGTITKMLSNDETDVLPITQRPTTRTKLWSKPFKDIYEQISTLFSVQCRDFLRRLYCRFCWMCIVSFIFGTHWTSARCCRKILCWEPLKIDVIVSSHSYSISLTFIQSSHDSTWPLLYIWFTLWVN